MLVVQIVKPEDEPLARWFENLRNWLDTHGCGGVTFARSLKVTDRVLYRLSFDDDAKARDFSGTFARYLPDAAPAAQDPPAGFLDAPRLDQVPA